MPMRYQWWDSLANVEDGQCWRWETSITSLNKFSTSLLRPSGPRGTKTGPPYDTKFVLQLCHAVAWIFYAPSDISSTIILKCLFSSFCFPLPTCSFIKGFPFVFRLVFFLMRFFPFPPSSFCHPHRLLDIMKRTFMTLCHCRLSSLFTTPSLLFCSDSALILLLFCSWYALRPFSSFSSSRIYVLSTLKPTKSHLTLPHHSTLFYIKVYPITYQKPAIYPPQHNLTLQPIHTCLHLSSVSRPGC